jgi:cytoskeletal protein RodZ
VHQDTKISVEVIESLEQDDYGSFASDTYLKGFLRSYARYLDLDGDKLWTRISRKDQAVGESGGTAYWDTEETVHEERLGSRRIFRRFVVPLMIVIIIILAILLVRERRKVESLTTGAAPSRAHDGVTTIASDL